MATPKIIGQSGDAFLADVGDPPDANDHPTARVYDRGAHVLHPPFARDSIVARGYWTDPALDEETRSAIVDEVAELL